MARRRKRYKLNTRNIWVVLLVILVTVAWQIYERNFRERVPDAAGRPMAYAGLPKSVSAGDVEVLVNEGFVVGYSESRKNPLWVAYRLYRLDHFPELERPGNFQRDERTYAGVTEQDYSRTGYDRGHMAPNDAIGDCYGPEAQKDTFLMSNVCPQKHALNGGLWERLEQAAARNFAVNCVEVWVVCGPIFDPRSPAKKPRTLKSGVAIPDRFYKIFLDEDNGQPRVLAFDIPQNAKENDSLDRYLTSVDAIEAATGLDFFREFEDQKEAALESQVAPRLW